MDSTDYVSTSTAGVLAGVPEETVQQWIADGKLPAIADRRGRRVRLMDVQRLVTFKRTSTGHLAATIENSEAGTTAAVDEDAAAMPARDDLLAKLDHLYAEQIAARDEQIAARDELIAELCSRAASAEQQGAWAEPAEQQAAMVGEHDDRPESRAVVLRPQLMPLQRHCDKPAAVSVRQPAVQEVVARREHPSRALWHGPWALVAPAVALILAGMVLSQVFARAAPAGMRDRALGPSFMRFDPIAGPSLSVSGVLAQNVGLVGPRKAVPLPGGQIAVADTGNRRLVLLDPAGHLVARVRAGGLQQPVAVVPVAGALDVLDAARGTIERYDTAGRYLGEIIHAPALVGGRDMALGQGGLLYVANPRANAIVVLSTQGKILYGLSSPRGPGKEQLDAPADVAVGPGGNLYVADSANNRIQVLAPSGMFVAQWPAPPSTPQQPVQLVPLPDGRVLAADPTGALLVYPPDSALPVLRHPLAVPAGQPRAVGPSGLALRAGGTMLVTDGRSNRLLIMRLPR